MPPSSRYRRPSDESYVAGIARGKIYREFRQPDPNLRICVGHANMLDHINAIVVKTATQKRSRKTQASQTNSGPNSRIREISDEYLSMKPQAEHVENVSAPEDNECNLSLNNHFSVIGNEYEDDSPPSSPPSSPPGISISVSSIELDDSDECDEFGLPPRVQKTQHHAPPLLISSKSENECPATGLLATLTVSEVLSTEEWEED